MLEFWFNKQVPTFKKLMILIITLLICIGLYQYQPLPLDTILMFTGTGVIFLICRYFNLHFAQRNPTGLLYRLFTWVPLA
ncbi:MAG TPA: hypothetical protein DEA77_13015, partial [Acinetobacter nosocomialis]|nr:hypothetical protein [Acinetobacter nosocomialis]